MIHSSLGSSLSVTAFGVALTAFGGGDDGEYSWPQWDGPTFDVRSAETDWTSEGKGENAWEMPVGIGYSTVVVEDGRLFTMGYDEEAGLDLVWCLDAETGDEIWVHTYPAEIWNQAHRGGTVNTPSIDGDRLYTLNREGNAYCLSTETGEVIWHQALKEQYDLTYPTWGFSGSPLVLGNELILNCGKILSLNKDTGELVWASKDYGHAYCTPVAFELAGQPACVVVNGEKVGVVSRKDGKELMSYDYTGTSRGVNAATPIVIDDAVFVSSGPRGTGTLLAFAGDEMVPVWETRQMANSFSGCVKIGDHLFGFDQQVLKCIDMEGNTTWQERGIGNGALMAAGDRLIVMSADGELIIAKTNPEEFEELSRAKIFDESQGRYWTRPILVNGLIYCRSNEGMLVARDHRPVAKD